MKIERESQFNTAGGSDNDFLAKISQSESSALKTLAYLNRNMFNAVRSKYGLCSYDGVDAIKYAKLFRCCL